ncbi:MAG: hypothetical protein V7765_04155 [Oleispira sp.]
MKQPSQSDVSQVNRFGQNIAVQNNYIQSSVSSENITPSVEGVMRLVRVRKFVAAREHVSALMAMTEKNIETAKLLPVLEIIINLASGHKKGNFLRTIGQATTAISNPVFLDIAISASLRAEVLLSDISEAEELYRSIDNPGEFSQEVYYESIANSDALENRLDDKGIRQNEVALCALARGLLLRGSPELADQAAKLLVDRFPDFNSSTVHLIILFATFCKDVPETQYWLLKGTEFKRLSLIVNEAISLMEICRGDDVRVVDIASKLLMLSNFENENLVNSCRKFLPFFEQVNSDIFRELSDKSGIYDENNIAKRGIRNDNTILKLNNSQDIPLTHFVNFLNYSNKEKLSVWYAGGGRIESLSEIEDKFNEIHLLTFLGNDGPVIDLQIKDLVKVFVSTFSNQLSCIHAYQINHVVECFMKRGMNAQVYLLLNELIDPRDIWLSPIIKNYIDALLQIHKQQTLSIIFLSMPTEDWDEFLWLCYSGHLKSLNDFSGALNSIENAIAINPKSILAWSHCINLHKILATNTEEYSRVLSRIPDAIFEKYSELSGPILYELLNRGFFSRAEFILVKWFLNDPNAISVLLTNLSLGSIQDDLHRQAPTPSMTVPGCIGAFRYALGKDEIVKIVVPGSETKYECLIGEDSPMGRQLMSMSVGDSEMVRYKKIQLLEVLPPYIACFRIALGLRDKNNDGTDCFYPIELPESSEDLIPFMKDIILSGEEDKENRKLEMLANPNYPLFTKGKVLGDSCPVHTAANYLSNRDVSKQPFIDIGIEEYNCILLDVYSVTYLGISGLIYGLMESGDLLAITIETEAYLKNFMKDIHNPQYLRAGIYRGEFSRTTSEDILSQTKDLQVAIEYVLNNAEIPAPEAADIPESVAFTEKVVDASVYSTMRLAVSNNIPWLCIDTMFARLFHTEGHPVVNNHRYFLSIGSNTQLKEKLPGLILHCVSGLPFVTSFPEFIQLSESNLPSASFTLSKTLLLHNQLNMNPNDALRFLSLLVTNSLKTALSEGQFDYGLRKDSPANNGHTERVFNACCILVMRVQEGKALENLALFFLHISYRSPKDGRFMPIANSLANTFMRGNFISESEVRELISEFSETSINE